MTAQQPNNYKSNNLWLILIVNLFLLAGRTDVAVEMYKKGIVELQKGIAVEIKGQGRLYGRTPYVCVNNGFMAMYKHQSICYFGLHIS